ncbi:MAG: sensor histidine kinase, partial [Oceanidesulfovibrio sp.]
PLLDDERQPFAECAIRTDVSEKKRLEAETIRAGQLAALGELAAGVAHEINNPLNGIVNYAEIIHEEDDPEVARELSAKIIREGERVSRIVSKLLAFARTRTDDFEPVNVTEIVSDALQLLEGRMSREGVTLEVRVDDSVPRIRARAHEMRQVLLNLLNNALHAVTHGALSPERRIRVEARENTRDGRRFVDIHVIDNGHGIPASIMDRILTPFFTTKRDHEGSGLGLSISHSIAEEHEGRLSITSEENRYTRATLSVPAYEHQSFP